MSLILFSWLALGAPSAAQHEHASTEPEKLGTVHFATSCNPAVQADFNRAVAMLPSFWYQKSGETFAEIARVDPRCAMAEWGVAMTHDRQLWDPPAPADLEAGWSAVQKAKSIPTGSQREQAYVAAMETFYKDGDKIDHHTRTLAYEHAMEQASAILEAIFAEQNHPGLAHYIIHCDDYPSLAPQARNAARLYAQIAPDAPHALQHAFAHLYAL